VSKRICVLTAIAVLAFPALAGAKIVVSQSIAGVSLGETMKQVRNHLGVPSSIDHKGPKSTCLQPTCWVYGGRKLLIGFGGNGHAVEVFTENPSQRTPGGIGVGSSQAAVKSHIKGVTCTHVPGFTGTECIVSARHGSANWTTDFHVGPHGHVQSVLVNVLTGTGTGSGTGGALDRALSARL
jgi:hypothetical protein